MSLAIDIDRVTKVLLADGWQQVSEASFTTDAYEYVLRSSPGDGGIPMGGDGTGFAFRAKSGRWIAGPLSSVLAVEWEDDRG